MWSRCSAGSAVALCGGRGGHRLLSCAAARRRAPGASASAKGIPRSALRASVTPEFVTAAPDEAVEESSVEREPAAENKLRKLACPICYYPLISSSDQSAPVSAASSSSLECSTCKKFYPNRGDYWDMTVAVGSTEYSESTTVTTEVFRTPLVSFLYERGWRQNFIWSGFPGLERERDMINIYAQMFTQPFSLRQARKVLFASKLGLAQSDFSENMLKQCNEYVKQENISDKYGPQFPNHQHLTLALARADISRLPFVSGSIDAVHAAAAIHCWPSPACAVAEISRVLRPGGVFVASTFVADILPPAVPVLRIGRPIWKYDYQK
uniref:Methyltransferase type 11 domain-containing protein n=1 Tax=Oryza sativa subsp. japonica TaxID=39947 RepID=Q6ZAJ3_ORYSJ|nr:hypothetical protein [Oryza sativa Japonica Group]